MPSSNGDSRPLNLIHAGGCGGRMKYKELSYRDVNDERTLCIEGTCEKCDEALEYDIPLFRFLIDCPLPGLFSNSDANLLRSLKISVTAKNEGGQS